MYILGISAFDRDSAACILKDGEIIAAAQEGVFTGKKHDSTLPLQAIHYCLTEAGIEAKKVGLISFYEEPRKKKAYLWAVFWQQKTFRNFFLWLRYFWRERNLQRKLHDILGFVNVPLLYVEKQLAQAAAAFYPSPFEKAVVMVLSDQGSNEVECFGMGHENKIEVLHTQNYPHSLGLLYAMLTAFLGYKPFDEENMVIPLAAQGKNIYTERIYKHFFSTNEQGVFFLSDACAHSFFDVSAAKKYFSKALKVLPRKRNEPLKQVHYDVAASFQAIISDFLLQKALALFEHYQLDTLCVSGEIAHNPLLNHMLLYKGPFRKVWTQPAAGNAAGALGASLYSWHFFQNQPRKSNCHDDPQKHLFLGPGYNEQEILSFLHKKNVSYRAFNFLAEVFEKIASFLAEGHVVGCFFSRLEFSRNALGSRSILADPRLAEAQTLVQGGDFAIMVLKEQASAYFYMEHDSPYGMFAVKPKDNLKKQFPICQTHPLVRVQTVENNVGIYNILKQFEKLTGVGALLSISFRNNGEGLVNSPEIAFKNFLKMDIDYLLLERFLVSKRGG